MPAIRLSCVGNISCESERALTPLANKNLAYVVFQALRAFKVSSSIKIVRVDFSVLGSAIKFKLLRESRDTVLVMLIVCSLKSISDQFKAEISPERIPEYANNLKKRIKNRVRRSFSPVKE